MNTTTITEAKNRLSSLIDRVRAGESILILDRGVPVARLEPVTSSPDQTGRVRRLQRAGVIRVGEGRVSPETLLTPPTPLREGVSGVAVLLEDRRSGR
ncbi:MAG TPA: type II toxin-antitoxin system prevent-host-death family antitoxin [Candidatus Limnocylindrales bacterium]